MSQNWDGNVINLQVTDAKERTIELRCEGREKVIDFLQKAHPQALSTQRAEVRLEPDGAGKRDTPPKPARKSEKSAGRRS
jgi:hypothetical protein